MLFSRRVMEIYQMKKTGDIKSKVKGNLESIQAVTKELFYIFVRSTFSTRSTRVCNDTFTKDKK